MNSTLEIVSDEQAFIVGNKRRFELTGGIAKRIIGIYRHQQTHGQVMADTFLMGVIAGMEHAALSEAERILAEIRKRSI